jgi:hypothetical protein
MIVGAGLQGGLYISQMPIFRSGKWQVTRRIVELAKARHEKVVIFARLLGTMDFLHQVRPLDCV